MTEDNRLSEVRPHPDEIVLFDLHPCEERGHWVGVTDRPIYADQYHSLWIEGYHASVVPLETGAMQVQVREGAPEDGRETA